MGSIHTWSRVIGVVGDESIAVLGLVNHELRVRRLSVELAYKLSILVLPNCLFGLVMLCLVNHWLILLGLVISVKLRCRTWLRCLRWIILRFRIAAVARIAVSRVKIGVEIGEMLAWICRGADQEGGAGRGIGVPEYRSVLALDLLGTCIVVQSIVCDA